MLIGVPASGKSTYFNQFLSHLPVVSSDGYIEEKAKEEGKTYDEVFLKYVKAAGTNCTIRAKQLVNLKKSFVWDQTNLTFKTREAKLKLIPKEYIKRAIVFETPRPGEWLERLNSRPGKTIPSSILKNMAESFQMPLRSEGFDSIEISTFTPS